VRHQLILVNSDDLLRSAGAWFCAVARSKIQTKPGGQVGRPHNSSTCSPKTHDSWPFPADNTTRHEPQTPQPLLMGAFNPHMMRRTGKTRLRGGCHVSPDAVPALPYILDTHAENCSPHGRQVNDRTPLRKTTHPCSQYLSVDACNDPHFFRALFIDVNALLIS
jgi:hypothetical protein